MRSVLFSALFSAALLIRHPYHRAIARRKCVRKNIYYSLQESLLHVEATALTLLSPLLLVQCLVDIYPKPSHAKDTNLTHNYVGAESLLVWPERVWVSYAGPGLPG